MPEEETVIVPKHKDFRPKLKFAITAAIQLTVGLAAVAASAAVTVYVAKNFPTNLVVNLAPTEN